MNIVLYNNTSEKNALNKTLINPFSIDGNLRDDSNIKTPVIQIYHNGVIPYNYVHIPDFSRYYYIDEITSVRTGIWRLQLVCDVLMSFRTDILKCYAVIDSTEETATNEYIRSDIWQTLVKNLTDIINFPNGLLENGEYILITAGG